MQLPQTETQYSRTGLILKLNKMMRCLTGRNFLLRARTTTRFLSFLRLAMWDDQDREGSISSHTRCSSWVSSSCLSSKHSFFLWNQKPNLFPMIFFVLESKGPLSCLRTNIMHYAHFLTCLSSTSTPLTCFSNTSLVLSKSCPIWEVTFPIALTTQGLVLGSASWSNPTVTILREG